MRTPRPWTLPSEPALREHLLGPGVTPAMLRTRVGSGDLLRIRPGVYLGAAHWPQEPVARLLVRARAEQVVAPQAVISHSTAALAWGLPRPGIGGWDTTTVHLCVPRAANHRGPDGIVLHRPVRLPRHHVTQDPDGYPLTTVSRTCIDLARRLPLPAALVLLDAGARRLCEAMVHLPHRSAYADPRLTSAAREALEEAIDTCRATRLRTALALINPSRESPIESLTAGQLYLSGLPMPLFQQPIRTTRGVFYPDCLWPEHRLIGEADGAVKYADARAFVAEKEREQALRDLGYHMVRWLGREILQEPNTVIARIGRALAVTAPTRLRATG